MSNTITIASVGFRADHTRNGGTRWCAVTDTGTGVTTAEFRAQLQAALDALPEEPKWRWEGDSIVGTDGEPFGCVYLCEIGKWVAVLLRRDSLIMSTRAEARAHLAAFAGIEADE